MAIGGVKECRGQFRVLGSPKSEVIKGPRVEGPKQSKVQSGQMTAESPWSNHKGVNLLWSRVESCVWGWEGSTKMF